MRSSVGHGVGLAEDLDAEAAVAGRLGGAGAGPEQAVDGRRGGAAGEADRLHDLGNGADRGELAVGLGDEEDLVLLADLGADRDCVSGEDDLLIAGRDE